MEKWEDYFEVKEKWIDDGDFGSGFEVLLILKSTDEIVGKYRDSQYAKKQAKYKFKKMLSKIEKILLG